MPAEEKRLEIFFRTTVTRRCMFSFITDRRPSLQRITMAMIIPHKMRNTEISKYHISPFHGNLCNVKFVY